MTNTDTLLQDAATAYDNADQAWFNSQTTEALAFMWSIACDINAGAAWDDEVYDALAQRGHFDESAASTTKGGGSE